MSQSVRSTTMASMSKPTMLVALVAMLTMAVIEPHFASAQGEGGDNQRGGWWWRSPPPPPRRSPPPPRSSPPPPRSSPPPPRTRTPPPPRCTKPGGVCGDPKIVGGDGVTFYFHGRMNQDFCLVSDSDLHINAHFIGKRPEGRFRDFTWVQALGFVYGPHALTIAAKRVAKWDNGVDQLQLSYNGHPLELDGSSWASPDGVISLNRIGATNAVDLTIKEKMGVALTVVPIGQKESKGHGYGIGDDDCFAHFDMQFRFYNLSSSVDGVLGQTYQPDYVNPTKRGVAMPIMGGADRFFSSSLLATDCKMSKYSGLAIPVGSAMPSFDAVCGTNAGSLSAGMPGGLICRR
ncbi:hypothetical protein M758_8G136200 [Ceratodon purpureus]|nr:hypothetical protein M758_8G136200 [Ceratodon purpureus]